MIILTSCVACVADHIQANYLKDKNYRSVLFIDTAAEPEVGKESGDDDWLLADLEALQNVGYQVDRYSVTDKSREAVREQIEAYDIIYMCGGNTIYLLEQLQQTETYALIKEAVRAGKPYIGTSAGSIIAGPQIPAYLEDETDIELSDYTGFQFTNTIIVPHWGSESFRDIYLDGRVEAAYNNNELPFLLLGDQHYVVLSAPGASLQVIAVEK